MTKKKKNKKKTFGQGTKTNISIPLFVAPVSFI